MLNVHRRSRALGCVITALLAAVAPASTYTVNSTGDGEDTSPGNDQCKDSTDQCTLRAAIQEANAHAGDDVIVFGMGSGIVTITPQTALPDIVDPVTIDGSFNGAPRIELKGQGAAAGMNGLIIEAGNCLVRGLIVNDWGIDGIVLHSGGNNRIFGNYIGTNAAGTAAISNYSGINVYNSANNQIGSDLPADRNILSGNVAGVVIGGLIAIGNRVQGNYIGTDVTGTARVPNSVGILLTSALIIGGAASQNLIGGVSNVTPESGCAGACNLISGNSSYGIWIAYLAHHNTIQGNFIGTDVTGTQALGNTRYGVAVEAPDNTIGGETPESRNLISGSGDSGVGIWGSDGTRNRVTGNYIGTDRSGSNDLGNAYAGVVLTYASADGSASNNVVGGTSAGAGNVIAGHHSGGGVVISGGATGNDVEGNRIGTNPAGTAVVPGSSGDGIQIWDAPANNVGGARTGSQCDGPCNLIAGAAIDGVKIRGTASSGNVVQGNMIGTNAAGADLGNTLHGVEIIDAPGNTVGMPAGSSQTTLGNVIAQNNGSGVVVTGNTAVGNTIRANEIHANALLGIDLGGNGVTANDNVINLGIPPPDNTDNDADEGPNHLFNFPVGVTANYEASNQIISGILSTADPAGATVDIYANQMVNAADRYQGQRYVISVTPNALGMFLVELAAPLPTGFPFLTATATSADNSTSEFSASVCRDMTVGDSMPNNPDNDGDGLCDNWEVDGIDFNGDGAADLVLAGADPNAKDLYVEVDHLDDPRFAPRPNALQDVVDAFAAAPVFNPTFATGIALHVGDLPDAIPVPANGAPLFGSEGPNGPEAPDDFNDFKFGLQFDPCDGYFGTADERDAPDCADILGARRLAYRYCLFGNRYSLMDDGNPVDMGSATGISETPGNDLMVTLGAVPPADIDRHGGGAGVGPYNCTDCLRVVQAGTFMHELGHTLGLHHGGDSQQQNKPNYLSVMNYTFQTRHQVPSRPLDYSRWVLPPGGLLNEAQLIEDNGIDGNSPPDDLIARWPDTAHTWFNADSGECEFQITSTVGSIDWDNDGIPHETIQAGINDDGADAGSPACQVNNSDILGGFDDWANLRYGFRHGQGFLDAGLPASAIPDELTSEEAMARASVTDFDNDGRTNDVDNCMTLPNPNQEDMDGDGVGDICDGCPTTSNPGQADADRDRVGDACDACPGTAPGTTVCADGCPLRASADDDGDGDVDLTDLQAFTLCFGRSGMPVSPACLSIDFDLDSDVDLDDFGFFQKCYSGPGNAADPGCTGCPPGPEGMVLIPPGVFQMGNWFNESATGDELPVHAVDLDAFYIDRKEVTNQQFVDALNWAWTQGGLIAITPDEETLEGYVHKSGDFSTRYCHVELLGTSGDHQIIWDGEESVFTVKAGKENYPMVEVRWYGAAAYGNWHSAMEGKQLCYNTSSWVCDFSKDGYRLPTEAEWEKAARGGQTGHRFPWYDADTIQHSRANYRSHSPSTSYDTSPTQGYHPDYSVCPDGSCGGYPYTSPVGSFDPNGYGIYDVAGNVHEWCNDWYGAAYYSSSPLVNPRGPASGSQRVLRGGSWAEFAANLRCASREQNSPDLPYYSSGFRLAAGFASSP